MSVQKRRCATCKFFNDAQMSGNGWCTHPKRQLSTDVRILVRKGELACRNSWGGDLWLSTDSQATISEPAETAPEVFVSIEEDVDDRVTLVSNQTPDAASREDIVVEHSSMLSDEAFSSLRPRPLRPDEQDDELNTPAYEDQSERAQVIAKGSRNAILRARERHLKRRGVEPNVDRPVTRDQAEAVESDNGAKAPAEARNPEHAAPVPVSEMGRSSGTFVSHPMVDRFSSIPEIRSDVELPRLRQFLQSPESGDEGSRNNGQPLTSSSYDLVLQRAQAIKSAAQTKRSNLVLQDRSCRSTEMAAVQNAREAIQSYQKPFSTVEENVAAPEPEPTDERMRVRTRDAFGFSSLPADIAVNKESASDNQDSERRIRFEEDDGAELFSQPTASITRRRWWNRKQQMGPGESNYFTDEADEFADHPNNGISIGAGTFQRDESEAGLEFELDDEVLSVEDTSPGGGDHDLVEDYVISDATEDFGTESVPYQESLTDAEFDFDPEDDEILDTGYTEDRTEASRAFHVADATATTVESDEDHGPRFKLPRTAVPDAGFDLQNESGLEAFRAALFGEVNPGGSASREQHPVTIATDVSNGTLSRTSRPAPVEPRREFRSGARDERPAPRVEHSPMLGEPRQSSVQQPTQLREVRSVAPAFDIRAYVSAGVDLLDMKIDLAPELARNCRNCRDFRPSESGERGWCTNNWAFSHRQMVNADDLPCNSTIGCWWLPVDHSWLPALDQDFQEERTPLTDRLIASRYQYENEEDSELYVREI